MSARTRTARNALLALAAALLAACAATPRGSGLPELSGWQQRQAVLAAADSWGFSGRIAVSDGADGFNGNLHWEQRRDYFDARVSGPLGAGTVLIAGDARNVTVTDKDGEVTELNDAEHDLRRLYGWHIPVASLRYWALGIPDPARPAETDVAADGTLSELRQGGWTVAIDRYREHAGQPLPRRITATRDESRVRLVIDRWVFH